MKRRTFFSSAVACWALGVASLGLSSAASAQAPAVDPAAVQKLKRMSEFLDSLQRFSVETQSTLEDLHESGHRVDVDVTATVTVARPDRLRAIARVLDEVDAALHDAIGDLADRVHIGRLIDDQSTASPLDNPMWHALAARARATYPGASLLPQLEIGATDARFFRRRGTVAYGTGLFSADVTYEDMISRFHGNDERIDVESLRLTTDLWLGVVHDLLG